MRAIPEIRGIGLSISLDKYSTNPTILNSCICADKNLPFLLNDFLVEYSARVVSDAKNDVKSRSRSTLCILVSM